VRVLYFGTYERRYPRNAQVISCLRGAGVDVLERHIAVWEKQRHKFSPSVRDTARLAVGEVRLALSRTTDADVLIVGYPGHFDMLAAARVARGRPIVFNPLVSLDDTISGDRGLVDRRSPTSWAIRLVDRVAFRRASLVVADTAAHARYFAHRYELPDQRVAVCYVGAEDSIFKPGPRGTREFDVLFVGKLIPLHGLATILEAAALCPEITFRVVGTGQHDVLLADRPPNVHWEPWVEYERLAELYRLAGCALGIFGTSQKARRVIPNKAYQALATETPLITMDTPAARELLEHERDALLVAPGDANALAAAVRTLADNPELRAAIASRGRATYERNASEEALGRRWRDLLESCLRR
jgi:glycosyltransferase involved in cell wall biosynthesis